MAKRGRFQLPVDVARAKRGKGPAVDTADPLTVPAGQPDQPADMSADAAAEWSRLAGDLELSGRLATIDRWELTRYCETWALWRRAAAAVRLLEESQAALWGTDANGKPLPSSDCLVFCELSEQLVGDAAKFGLTPRTRSLDHSRRGRPAKPIEAHLLNGDPSRLMKNKDRIAAQEALKRQRQEVEVGSTDAPGGLSSAANDEWAAMMSQLLPIGLYTQLDRATLAVGCVSFAMARMAERQLQEQPLTLLDDDTGREKKHPLLIVRKGMLRVLDMVAKEFGMGPTWRKRWGRIDNPTNGDGGSRLKVFMGSRTG